MKLGVVLLLMLWSIPAWADDFQEDYSRGGYALYDTTITTTSSSIDTVYFGAMGVHETFEVSGNPISISWHQDWRAFPPYSVPVAVPVIQSGRRKGLLFIDKTKAWTIGAGAAGNYAVPVSGMIVRGVTGPATVHIQVVVRVR